MKTFTCANVPEGHFTFDELLELDLVKDAIRQLKARPHPQKQKVKTLVFTMQYIDVVAAFDEAIKKRTLNFIPPPFQLTSKK